MSPMVHVSMIHLVGDKPAVAVAAIRRKRAASRGARDLRGGHRSQEIWRYQPPREQCLVPKIQVLYGGVERASRIHFRHVEMNWFDARAQIPAGMAGNGWIVHVVSRARHSKRRKNVLLQKQRVCLSGESFDDRAQ